MNASLPRLAWLIVICFAPVVQAAEPPAPDWAKLEAVPHREGQYRLTVTKPPADDKLSLPAGFPNVLRAWQELRAGNRPLTFEYLAEGGLRLAGHTTDGGQQPVLALETTPSSPQTPDGRRVFLPAQAQLTAPAMLEKSAGHERISRWVQSEEPVVWKFDATRWGKYQVVVIASSHDRTEIELSLGDVKLEGALPQTTGSMCYATTDLGKIYLAKAGPQTLSVRAKRRHEAPDCSLAAVLLVPACEGNPPVQAADGTVTLHGQDATVEGTVLRYEPAPTKLTLGFWIKATDAASWQLTVKQPGEFDVEVLQGCGAGQGGSSVLLTVGGQELRFEVEDTGHFQNFKPRTIGRVKLDKEGAYTLRVGPEKIARQAALDLRQVRLTPVK